MAYLSPIGNGYSFFINGVPANGAKLFIYTAGTTTKATTYSNSAGTVSNTNPIVLNSRGESANPIWVNAGTYKFVLAPSTDSDPPVSPVWTLDNIAGINENTASLTEWLSSATPTYVSATQFTVVGNQTSDYHVNRRVKLTPGNVGARISATSYSSGTNLTTATLVVDGGAAIDPGLTAASLAVLRADIPSEPHKVVTGTHVSASLGSGIAASLEIATGLGTDDYDFSASVKGGLSAPAGGLRVQAIMIGYDARFSYVGEITSNPVAIASVTSGSFRLTVQNNAASAQTVTVYWWARKRYA